MPWAHDMSIASAPRGAMKSLDLKEIIDFVWFSCGFSKSARAEHVRCVLNNQWFFMAFMLKRLQAQCVRYDFGMFARVMTLLVFW